MTHKDEVRVARLRREADKWIEEEMEARMAAAAEEIAVQAEVASNAVPESVVQKHVEEATRYARQEMLRELELEAESWIERKLKDQDGEPEPMDPDDPCGGCTGCCG